ncbi:MAG: glutamate-5-semialdehyde dehydrogenase [Gemmataceae bacterium]|nr:glutamate-5-semialdehyde dehydrogenase [Gemmataceae bacterium]
MKKSETHLAQEIGAKARLAARALSLCSTASKNQWLKQTAERLPQATEGIMQANARDLASAANAGMGSAQLDRLRLDPARIGSMAKSLEEIALLEDPVGRVISSTVRPNGLVVKKTGVPLGVIFFIYESRPNVTVDAGALAIKSGNAIILRGGKEALHSNLALVGVLRSGLAEAGIPLDAIQLIDNPDRKIVGDLLTRNDLVDLVIPRGGEELIRRVSQEARMPVMKHYRGNCHVYVETTADMEMAIQIIINAKCQRPGVCNAAESLLVDREIAPRVIPRLVGALQSQGVEIRGCQETCLLATGVVKAVEGDFSEEYLDKIISLKVVEGIDEAMEHIARYGSGHTEAILTQNPQAAERFTQCVDSAAVMVNASTRFNDGGELGLGAEIGISTDKYHARGPCGLNELTSYKYVILGKGQVRE